MSKDQQALYKYGFSFEDDGDFANYSTIYKARLEEYNKAIASTTDKNK